MDALRAELVEVRAAFGVHVSFEPTLRCALTKRRLVQTLHHQLHMRDDMRAALGGRTTFFTSAEPAAAANAMLAAHAATRSLLGVEDVEGAAESTGATRSKQPLPIWLSSQDTPTGWQLAVSAARQERAPAIYFRDGRPQHGHSSPVASVHSAPPLHEARPAHVSAHAARLAETALRELRALERGAATVLGVRSLAPEAPELRAAPGYASLLATLNAPALGEALRMDGGWADGRRASSWQAVVVPRLSMRALCKPSLQPRLMKIRLPIGCHEAGTEAADPACGGARGHGDRDHGLPPGSALAQMPALLNGEGVATIRRTHEARQLLAECTQLLGLRALQVDEVLQPSQVICAARALLAQAHECRELGSEGCVLRLGANSGFAMASDGVLRVQWDAL